MAVAAQLKEKNLIMFVGPASVGKSFLMNHIMEHDIDFGRVSVFTTREARPDDEPGMFRNLPHDDANVTALLGKIQRGEVVQYAVHPTSGRIYGSEITDYGRPEITDYGRPFSMLATLSGIVNTLRKLPFQTTHVIGLAVDPDIWLNRFYERYPEPSDERTKRLQEAAQSLQWLLDPAHIQEINWIDNSSSNEAEAVQAVINTVKFNKRTDPATLRIAHSMLERLQKELSS